VSLLTLPGCYTPFHSAPHTDTVASHREQAWISARRQADNKVGTKPCGGGDCCDRRAGLCSVVDGNCNTFSSVLSPIRLMQSASISALHCIQRLTGGVMRSPQCVCQSPIMAHQTCCRTAYDMPLLAWDVGMAWIIFNSNTEHSAGGVNDFLWQ